MKPTQGKGQHAAAACRGLEACEGAAAMLHPP